MSVTRLSGGLTPADGADPRTFPTIFNSAVDEIEQLEADVLALDGRVTATEGDVTALDGRVTSVEGDLATLDTDDVAEATNLYYTNARADARIAAATTDNISEGSTNLYYTDARVLAVAAPALFVENVQTANYTLALSDAAKVVAMNSSSARTVTVPPNTSVAFPVGTVVNVYRAGTGAVTIAQGSGVTVRNVGAIRAQFGEVSLRKRGTNEWVLAGDVS